jgi:outer membrane protein
MNLRPLGLALLIFLLGNSTLVAQSSLKIGYVNLEMVMAFMPETEAMNQELEVFNQQLQKRLQAKEQYFQVKYSDYQELAQTEGADPARLAAMEKELQKLSGEVQAARTEVQQKLSAKQQVLMGPVLERMQAAIKALASEGDFTYILNSTASSTSFILHGNEGGDLTEALFSKLDIEYPSEAATESQGGE